MPLPRPFYKVVLVRPSTDGASRTSQRPRIGITGHGPEQTKRRHRLCRTLGWTGPHRRIPLQQQSSRSTIYMTHKHWTSSSSVPSLMTKRASSSSRCHDFKLQLPPHPKLHSNSKRAAVRCWSQNTDAQFWELTVLVYFFLRKNY